MEVLIMKRTKILTLLGLPLFLGGCMATIGPDYETRGYLYTPDTVVVWNESHPSYHPVRPLIKPPHHPRPHVHDWRPMNKPPRPGINSPRPQLAKRPNRDFSSPRVRPSNPPNGGQGNPTARPNHAQPPAGGRGGKSLVK